MDLKRGIDLAVDAVVQDLKGRSKKVSTNEEIAQVGQAARPRETAGGCFSCT